MSVPPSQSKSRQNLNGLRNNHSRTVTHIGSRSWLMIIEAIRIVSEYDRISYRNHFLLRLADSFPATSFICCTILKTCLIFFPLQCTGGKKRQNNSQVMCSIKFLIEFFKKDAYGSHSRQGIKNP